MPTSPRSLADDLRARDDDALVALLRARPDLLSPVASDVGQLAARAITQASVRRALDRLDALTLQVVDVLLALPEPSTHTEVAALLGADPSQALDALHRQALVWGAEEGLRLVRGVRQLVGDPAGLGPSAATALVSYGPRRLAALAADLAALTDPADRAHHTDGTDRGPVAGTASASTATAIAALLREPGNVDALVADAPEAARAVLDRLTWGPPSGRVADAHRDVTVATARTPVDWLLARALLVATEAGTVVLPREVAIALRGGRVHARVLSQPPAVEATHHDPGLVDRTAGAGADAVVRLVDDLLEAWGLAGPPVLRGGGLGVRELRRVTEALDVDPATAALVVETAYGAGLLDRDREIDEAWRPTTAYDTWRAQPIAARWVRLVSSWLTSTRVAALVGTRDERDRARAALGPDLSRGSAPALRRGVLGVLAELEPGASPQVEAVRAVLAWRTPRQGGWFRDEMVAATLREAEVLGLTGLGALATPARALLDDDPAAAAAALEQVLPAPLHHVLLQADLTAVAPGPLVPTLARELALAADIESTGGATVYRFSERSVRRALDAGRSATDLHELFTSASRTPVPQPLTYLVDDVARRHGRIRVGAASAYVRCDDDTVLAALLADRRATSLGLRRLAPTVLTSSALPELVLERLRAMGFAPAAESADGAVVVRRLDSHRAPATPHPPATAAEPAPPSESLLAATVRAIRAGDAAPRGPHTTDGASTALRRVTPVEALDALREAARGGRALWIGYADAEGQSRVRVVEPIRVDGGQVSAFDHLGQRVRAFAVHRITGIAEVEPPAPSTSSAQP